MKLSIIVPVYNVAPYLRKCVDSLLTQDISDYEIILVDDGSTDDSGAIADEILNTHSQSPIANCQIKVVHQLNGGLSAARNTGISLATGKYILFVDSDDYLQPNTLGTLLEQAERDDLDVLRFRYQNVKESGEAFAPYKDMTNYNDYSALLTDGLTFLNKRMGNQCYVVQFLVKTEIVRQELFTPGIYFEDTDWTPRMLLRAKRVASTNLVVYNYLWREGSITLSQNDTTKMRKQLDDKMAILGRLNEWGNAVSDRRWFDGMISAMTISIVGIIANYLYTERKKYVELLKSLDILPISTYHTNPRAIKKVRLINFSLNLTIWTLKKR